MWNYGNKEFNNDLKPDNGKIVDTSKELRGKVHM